MGQKIKSDSEKCKRLSEKSHKYSQCRQEKCFLFTCWFIIAEKDRCVKMEVLVGAHDVEYDDKYGDYAHDECALVICWSWW